MFRNVYPHEQLRSAAMGVFIVTGVFGLLGILVKASIDSGSKATRWRRAIKEDLELLAKYREIVPNGGAVWDLEERLEREVVRYAWLGQPAPMTPPDEGSEVTHRGGFWKRVDAVADGMRTLVLFPAIGLGFAIGAALDAVRTSIPVPDAWVDEVIALAAVVAMATSAVVLNSFVSSLQAGAARDAKRAARKSALPARTTDESPT